MPDTDKYKSYPYFFIMLYAISYMANAVYNTFVPIYLDHVGFSKVAIGALLALAPFISIVAQPIWGIAGDRAKFKNSVLKLLIFASSLISLLYLLSSGFYYLAFIMSLFTFFQSSINPISDAITLEYLENTRWKFGPIRLAGTVGFAFMSVLAGIIAKFDINNIFILYSLIMLAALLAAFRVPAVKGHQSGGKRIAVWELLKNRELVLLMSFNMVIQTSLGFYYSFFPVYYRQMGASSVMLGISMFISAMSELPFLLSASGIMDKIGIKYLMLGSAGVIATRWLLLYHVASTYAVLPIMLMHGFSFIVFSYSMATYINKTVPRELRASGQTINWLVGMGISRIIGSIAGGLLTDIFGIRRVFLFDSYLAYVSVIIFGGIFIIESIRSKRRYVPDNTTIH